MKDVKMLNARIKKNNAVLIPNLSHNKVDEIFKFNFTHKSQSELQTLCTQAKSFNQPEHADFMKKKRRRKKSNFPDLFCKHCYVFIERFRWTDVSSCHPGLSGGASR